MERKSYGFGSALRTPRGGDSDRASHAGRSSYAQQSHSQQSLADSDPGLPYVGYLYRESDGFMMATWKRVYFVLEVNALHCFESENSQVELFPTFSLERATITAPKNKRQNYPFAFRLNLVDSRTHAKLILSADTKEETFTWVEAFRSAGVNNEDWVQRNPQKFSEFLRRRQSSAHVISQRADGGASTSGAPLSPQVASPSTNSVVSGGGLEPLPESSKLVMQNSAPVIRMQNSAAVQLPSPSPPAPSPALKAVQDQAAKRKSVPSANRTPISHGKLQFSGYTASKPSGFLHVNDDAPVTAVLKWLEDLCELKTQASVVISITGGAQDFNMHPRLYQAFAHGLAKATIATKAWVFTGGTDAGVMDLVGRALAEYRADVTCIGVAAWGIVHNREAMRGCEGGLVQVNKDQASSGLGANLEPNHSHFILVDAKKEGPSAWGSEISFRNELEAAYCKKTKTPRVLLVVQGGPGTLATVLEAVRSQCPVVLIADSGGVATLLDHFLDVYRDGDHQLAPLPFAENQKLEQVMNEQVKDKSKHMQVVRNLEEILEEERKNQRKTIFSFRLAEETDGPQGAVAAAQLDLHMLNAVLANPEQVASQDRLTLAVEWDRVDVVQQELKQPDLHSDSLRLSLYSALRHRRVAIIQVLLAQGGATIVKDLDIIALYQAARRDRVPLFRDAPELKVLDRARKSESTHISVYREVLLEFMERFIPGMGHRLSALQHPTLDDVLFWAVLVGESALELVECLWQQTQEYSDPIRIALVAAEVSRRAADACPTARNCYERNAKTFEGWAIQVLDRCHSEDDAMAVLLRTSLHWPQSIMRVAMDGESKQFIGHRVVQELVDNVWRGKHFLSQAWVPQDMSVVDILLCWMRLKKIELEVPTVALADPRKELWKRTALAGLKRKQEADKKEKEEAEAANSWGGLIKMTTSKWGGVTGAIRLAKKRESFQDGSHPDNRDLFVNSPKVKFVTQTISYMGFLCVYVSVLLVRQGSVQHLEFSSVELVFFAWALSLWISEMHQWKLNTRRGASHLQDMSNLLDVIVFTMLLTAFLARLAARFLCQDAIDGGPTELHRVYDTCWNLWWGQLSMACGVVICCGRAATWLVVSRDVGVLSVVLAQLAQPIAQFVVLWLVCVVGFSSAFVGLFPTLGAGAFTPDGPGVLPFWAMYGEFGDTEVLADAAVWGGTSVLWCYIFVVNILLVNLLIAMMTETYERVQRQADNEWRFNRVYLVDEFAGSIYPLPPPLSLPYLVYEFACSFYAWCRRCCCCEAENQRHKRLDTWSAMGASAWAEAHSHGDVLYNSFTAQQSQAGKKQVDLIWLAELIFDRARDKRRNEETQQIVELRKLTTEVEALKESVTRQAGPAPSAIERRGVRSDLQDQMEQMKSARTQLVKASTRAIEMLSEEQARTRGLEPQLQKANDRVASLERELRAEQDSNRKQRDALLQKDTELTSAAKKSQQHDEVERALEKQVEEAKRTGGPQRATHQKARSQHPRFPEERFAVPDEFVAWRKPWGAYAPPSFTADEVKAFDRNVRKNGWADPANVTDISPDEWRRRRSGEGPIHFDFYGRPVNPRGRTGMSDRGMLGKWGPNHAADPIVTRCHPTTGQLQMVAIKRGDTGDWAIPGGMVDDGEVVSVTLRREFTEEAGNLQGRHKEQFDALVETLFKKGELVYAGYVDDPRNTDNAWMETSAYHFHCSPELGTMLMLNAGTDAVGVKWLDIDASQHDYAALYASHRDWVDRIADQMGSPVVNARASDHDAPF